MEPGGTRGDAGARLLTVGEGALWTTVVVAAVYAASFGPARAGPGAEAYRLAYFADSVFLSLLLAAILLVPFRRPRDARPPARTVALPAILVAVLLHIAVWGVSASRWLTNHEPETGASLWTFMALARPLAFGIAGTFVVKVRRNGSGSPRGPRPGIRAWFPILSASFLALFGVAAAGAFLTARGVTGDWFGGGIAAWGYGAVAASAGILGGALLACARSNPGGPARVVLGPVGVAAVLAGVSLLGLLLPGVAADPRLDTGLLLFASYGGALFPSYGVLAALRLLAGTDGPPPRDPAP